MLSITNLCDPCPPPCIKTSRGTTLTRAAARLANGILGDDSFGSLAHLFAYMDDISLTVALEDVQFFCEEIDKLGTPPGCLVNPLKTRILTSCNGHSILPQLHNNNPNLASEIEKTISTYSITYDKITNKPLPVGLVDGFRLLETPIGSHSFAHEYYNEQISAVTTALNNLTKNIADIHTHLKLFTTCTIQKLPHLLNSNIMHNLPQTFNNKLA
jgi:hypothetical protein